MKTYNTTPNVSDLARWIDLQLSTIIEGVSAGYTLGKYNSVWIDKGSSVFNVSLANGETVAIDSDNYNTAEEIATAIISTLNNTTATMNANETQAPKFSELAHAKMKASTRTIEFGRNAGYYNPVDAFRFRASVLPDMYYNDDAEDQTAEIERYNRNAARCAKIAAKYGITLN